MPVAVLCLVEGFDACRTALTLQVYTGTSAGLLHLTSKVAAWATPTHRDRGTAQAGLFSGGCWQLLLPIRAYLAGVTSPCSALQGLSYRSSCMHKLVLTAVLACLCWHCTALLVPSTLGKSTV
jgi:hypothetical protein